jgi:hypothetical protein
VPCWMCQRRSAHVCWQRCSRTQGPTRGSTDATTYEAWHIECPGSHRSDPGVVSCANPCAPPQHAINILDAREPFPRDERILIKLNEDAFAMNLVGGDPVRLSLREACHLWSLAGSPDSSGASTRVKPNSALTSRSRSSKSTRLMSFSNPTWCAHLLAHEVRVVRGRIGFRQYIPLGSFDVFFIGAIFSAFSMRLYGRPDGWCSVLVNAWQSSSLFERLHRHGNFRLGRQVFEIAPIRLVSID